MAAQEQIDVLMEALRSAHPKELFQAMDETQAGIGAVLRLLSESEEPVTAGKIAQWMHVSTARVAVLLKKMAAKDLIVRNADPNDARSTIVTLSARGAATVEAMRNAIRSQLGTVIDQIGMERMLEFAAISREIQKIVRESHDGLWK